MYSFYYCFIFFTIKITLISIAIAPLRLCKAKPSEFAFVPKTFVLPLDYTNLQNYCNDLRKNKKKKILIVKPANGAMGNGYVIFLFRGNECFFIIMENGCYSIFIINQYVIL